MIEREEFEKKVNSLAELNDLLYACQLTYDEVTVCKRIQRGNWLEEEVDAMMALLETEPAGSGSES